MKIENNKPIELFPFYVDFAITYGCNARCQHCSINADFNAFGNSGDMDFKMICSIIDQLKNMGDRKSTRLNSSHRSLSRMPSSA